MTKFELAMTVLAGLSLVGVIVLLSLDKSIGLVLPVLTALVSWLLGRKQYVLNAVIAGVFKKKKKKK
jgi:hypothetical protein